MNKQLDLLGDEQPSYPTATVVEESAEECPQEPSPGAGSSSKAARIVHLAQQAPLLTDAEAGELDILLERHLNTASTPQLRKFLYDPPPVGCGFQKRYIREGTKNTTRLSTSIDALLANYRLKQDKRLELCLRLSDLLTQTETLQCKLDKDGRIRFALNIAGTKVGRMSAYASNTGSGYNLHGTQDRHKRLFLADEGHDLYSVDLKGADGWTLGAECSALGDTRMWDDLSAGLKPANAVVLLFRHGAKVNQWSMGDCLAAQKAIDKTDWAYKACKIGIWGTCYGLAEVTLSEDILERSWKSGQGIVNVSTADCRKLQNLMHSRYPGIKRRIERIKMLLQRDGYLVAASGLRRDFFSPKTDHQTLKDALPFTPAANTAHCCNLALLKLWADRSEGVRPLLSVHDALLFEAPIEKRLWVSTRIPAWFSNEIEVAGTRFTIPWETLRGPSWGQLEPL